MPDPHRPRRLLPEDDEGSDTAGTDWPLVLILVGGLLVLLAFIVLFVMAGEERTGPRPVVEPTAAATT